LYLIFFRDIYLKEQQKRKNARFEEKKAELEAKRKENPGLDIDEEAFLGTVRFAILRTSVSFNHD